MSCDNAAQANEYRHETSARWNSVICEEQSDEAANDSSMSHDVRAALAIASGFSDALRESFDQLQSCTEPLLEDERILPAPVADEVAMMEADCRFCLSRLQASVQRLKQKLQQAQLLDVSASNADRHS